MKFQVGDIIDRYRSINGNKVAIITTAKDQRYHHTAINEFPPSFIVGSIAEQSSTLLLRTNLTSIEDIKAKYPEYFI